MSSNVGLSTPRGSGTSGYVQRNLSHLRPRDHVAPYQKDHDLQKLQKHNQRQPDREILDHDRKRNVELKCFELRDKLEDEGVDSEDVIDEKVDALRKRLLGELNSQRVDARGLKSHQVHELAQAKMAENERIQRAFKISSTYEEGSHWRRQAEEKVKRQEEAAMREQQALIEARQKAEKERELEREKEMELRKKNRRDESSSQSRSRSPSRSDRGRRRNYSESRSRSRSNSSGSYVSRDRGRSGADRKEYPRTRSRSRSGGGGGADSSKRRGGADKSMSRSRSGSSSYSRDKGRRRYSDSD